MENSSTYTTTWAESTYRPLLEKIAFKNLDKKKTPILFAAPRLEPQYVCGCNAHCQLFVLLRDIADERLGYFTFYFVDETCRVAICLNKTLFSQTDNRALKTLNIVGTHEFLHCISALLCIPNLSAYVTKKKFLADCGAKMSLEILSAVRINSIAHDHNGQIMGRSSSNDLNCIFFSDEHYRLPLDRSALKYHNLYDRFLLSKQDFESFFSEQRLSEIKYKAKNGDIIEAYKKALHEKSKIATKLNLDESFVIRRISDIMIFYFQNQEEE